MRKILLVLFVLVALPVATHAHQPAIIATEPLRIGDLFSPERAAEFADPTAASQAIYGSIQDPDAVDVYTFTASRSEEIPVEVLVPVRASNATFRPWVAVFGEGLPPSERALPLLIPDGYGAMVGAGVSGVRDVFFEPFSIENLYHGEEITVPLSEGEVYYVAVYDPTHRTGTYSLGLGTVENFSDADFGTLFADVGRLKLGLHAGVAIPWHDIIGFFTLMTGFIIGLGAVTVIDFHGLLGRKSAYWTEATTRTHKVTKPMIWIGIALATIGGSMLYRATGFSGTAPLHLALLLVLILNGAFLSFSVSPYMLAREKGGKQSELLPASWQRKIAVSLVFSAIGWWGSLFLFAWHLFMLR